MEGVFQETTYGDRDMPGIYPKDLFVNGTLIVSGTVLSGVNSSDPADVIIGPPSGMVTPDNDLPGWFFDEDGRLLPGVPSNNLALDSIARYGYDKSIHTENGDFTLGATDALMKVDSPVAVNAFIALMTYWEQFGMEGSLTSRIYNAGVGDITVQASVEEVDPMEILGNPVIAAGASAYVDIFWRAIPDVLRGFKVFIK